MKSNIFSFIFKVAISTVLLWYVFSHVDMVHVWAAITRMPIVVLLIALGMQVLSVFLAAVKWHMILPRYTFSSVIRMSFVGQLYALVLPGQLVGEGAKAYRMARPGDIHTVASSVLIDKITGLMGLAVVFGYGILVSPLPVPRAFTITVAALIAGGIGFFFVLRNRRAVGWATAFLDFCANRIPSSAALTQLGMRMVEEIHHQSRRTYALSGAVLLGIFFQVFLVWISMVVAYGLGMSVAFSEWCWIFGVVSLVVLLPITVAGIGVREVSLVTLLATVGVSSSSALAFSFMILGLQIAMAVVGGALELFTLTRGRSHDTLTSH